MSICRSVGRRPTGAAVSYIIIKLKFLAMKMIIKKKNYFRHYVVFGEKSFDSQFQTKNLHKK